MNLVVLKSAYARSGQIEERCREDVAREIARSYAGQVPGRRGFPQPVVQTMYEDYLRLGSLAKTAREYGRTRQAQWDLFVAHGLRCRARNFLGKLFYAGRVFTPGKNGYFRATTGLREPLHHALWRDRFGPVPAGCQVTFLDGDKLNFQMANLGCLPVREVTLHHHRRHTTNGAHGVTRPTL